MLFGGTANAEADDLRWGTRGDHRWMSGGSTVYVGKMMINSHKPLEFELSHFQANPNFIWMPNSNSVDVPFGMSNGAP